MSQAVRPSGDNGTFLDWWHFCCFARLAAWNGCWHEWNSVKNKVHGRKTIPHTRSWTNPQLQSMNRIYFSILLTTNFPGLLKNQVGIRRTHASIRSRKIDQVKFSDEPLTFAVSNFSFIDFHPGCSARYRSKQTCIAARQCVWNALDVFRSVESGI